MKQFIFDYNNRFNWVGQKGAIGNAIQIYMDNATSSFKVTVDQFKETKKFKQLKAFYECRTQLLPQYNARQVELGEKEFFEDEFKFILKYVGGWYKTIKSKKGDIIPIEKSFKDITKEEMIIVLSNIQKWAIGEGYDLCIDEELRDFNNFYKVKQNEGLNE